MKPGGNARGSGISILDNVVEILSQGEKLGARIVQKYIENPLLLDIKEVVCKNAKN